MSVLPLLTSLPTGHNVTLATAASPCTPSGRRGAACCVDLRSQRHPHHVSRHLLSTYGGRSGCTIQAIRRPARFSPRFSQVSVEEGDSSSRQGTEYSENRINFLSHWSVQGSATPAFLSPVFALQDGIKSVRAKGLVQSSKDGFQEAYTGLRNLDGKSVLENILHSDAVAQGKRIWHQQEPWIKLPFATFVTLYLAIFISCGTAVAQDLIPLWIMGPIITGVTIRAGYAMVGYAQGCVEKCEPIRQAASSCVFQMYEDAKQGHLVDKTRSRLDLKNKELREGLAKTRSDFSLYIKSGQAASDCKTLLLRESSRFRDWSLERSEDFMEWIEPSWRSFSRLMKKLF